MECIESSENGRQLPTVIENAWHSQKGEWGYDIVQIARWNYGF